MGDFWKDYIQPQSAPLTSELIREAFEKVKNAKPIVHGSMEDPCITCGQYFPTAAQQQRNQ